MPIWLKFTAIYLWSRLGVLQGQAIIWKYHNTWKGTLPNTSRPWPLQQEVQIDLAAKFQGKLKPHTPSEAPLANATIAAHEVSASPGGSTRFLEQLPSANARTFAERQHAFVAEVETSLVSVVTAGCCRTQMLLCLLCIFPHRPSKMSFSAASASEFARRKRRRAQRGCNLQAFGSSEATAEGFKFESPRMRCLKAGHLQFHSSK